MRESVRLWHMDTLSSHNREMFNTLLYEHNIISDSLKTIDFEKENSDEVFSSRGYFAKKDRNKYWIDEKLLDLLPLRIGEEFEELKFENDIVLHPLKPRVFKITPQKTFNIRPFINSFLPFEHSNHNHWTLLKFTALMGFVGRIYCCVSSKSEFGKSSIYDVLHYLTDKSPVFKPRSIPGVLNHINGTGNIIFDETHRCKNEVLNIIEEFALQIGGGKANYINGALKSKNTKANYDCMLQSITFLYNNVENYSNPEKDYFEFIFSNNTALDSRFLKLKLDGKLVENFSKDFDIPKSAEENRKYYIDFAKNLLYLQELRTTNGYKRRWTINSSLQLKGRRKMGFEEILWLIDMYCENQIEFDGWVKTLTECIINYRIMCTSIKGGMIGEEEVVK